METTFKKATMEDFDVAFEYIQKLWDFNTYDKETIREVYREIINNDERCFAFFAMEGDEYHGFCQGDYFNNFWMSGKICYLSGIISNEDERGLGYGIKLMDHARELATDRGCKAIILLSGVHRSWAHRFYEKYGFEKGCYGFEIEL